MTPRPKINLFIVGAAKSGTTSLYNYLNQHPNVFLPKVKEPNYYSSIDSEDPLAYRTPKKGVFYHNKVINEKDVYYSLYEGSDNYKVVGDASPSYLWDISASKKIYSDFPNAKIIIILRNPSNRTFSHYLMNLKSGIEKDLDFLNALKRDKRIMPKVWGDGKVLLYEELSLYYNQVKTYFDVFLRENVKVIIYEEFFNNTEAGLEDVFEFLELEHNLNIDSSRVYNTYTSPKNNFSKFLIHSKSKIRFLRQLAPNGLKRFINKYLLYSPDEKPIMSDDAKTYLKEAFMEDIIRLEKLLNKNLEVWK